VINHQIIGTSSAARASLTVSSVGQSELVGRAVQASRHDMSQVAPTYDTRNGSGVSDRRSDSGEKGTIIFREEPN
jgi:hypothetical protein